MFLHTSAVDGLRSLDAGSVDLLFFDPTWMAEKRDNGRFAYEDPPDRVHYQREIIAPVMAEAPRVLKAGGTIAVWIDYRAACYWEVAIDLSGLQRNGEIIVESLLGNPGKKKWPVKHSNIILASKGEPWFDHEAMPTVERRSAAKPGYEGLKRVGSVIQGTMSNTDPQRVGYPDQKSLETCTTIIRTHCPVGGLVVDCYSGSGTTVIAALGCDRRGLGFDISMAAVELARSRLQGLADS
jgi:site-specific DNA-methyltransferase (adenine-specific)